MLASERNMTEVRMFRSRTKHDNGTFFTALSHLLQRFFTTVIDDSQTIPYVCLTILEVLNIRNGYFSTSAYTSRRHPAFSS